MKSKKIIFFFLGWVGMVFYSTQRWIYGPLIPSLMKEFGVSKTTLAVVGSSSLWGYMFTAMLGGKHEIKMTCLYLFLIDNICFTGLLLTYYLF